MGFPERVKREWQDVKGNAKWDLYKVIGAAVLALGAYLIHRLKYGPDWLPYAVAFILALFVFFWMGSRLTESSSTVRRLKSPDVLTESLIKKIEHVGRLRSLAGRADFLKDYLEEVWHVFLKEKKNMPNPIGVGSMPDKIEEWTDKQLWRFRIRYQDYTGSMEAVDPDCKSDLVKDGFPHEGEDYLSVERKIKEHADTLRKRANDLLAEAKEEYTKSQK